jgi:hypothetical protein
MGFRYFPASDPMMEPTLVDPVKLPRILRPRVSIKRREHGGALDFSNCWVSDDLLDYFGRVLRRDVDYVEDSCRKSRLGKDLGEDGVRARGIL